MGHSWTKFRPVHQEHILYGQLKWAFGGGACKGFVTLPYACLFKQTKFFQLSAFLFSKETCVFCFTFPN